MELSSPIATLALPAAALLLLSWLALRLRQRQNSRRGTAREALDTVAAWPPEAARVLTINERQAYDLLRRAMPGFLVLAQVPLSRFIRVPARHSYADWLGRVGSLSADLMLCDSGSKVLAVIDVRAQQESDRGRRRHERMARVLRAAGIHVFTWREGELPTPVEVRNALIKLVSPEQAQAKPSPSRPMPLIPVADIAEVLADGDRAALEADFDPRMEPVPSAFFDDLDPLPRQR
ncbi:MAG TPA: DUF2726 domain-containing protein [Rubrivivax sp.]|nr:DUF2726 domain-containing protein [Rubrivivax sp.]